MKCIFHNYKLIFIVIGLIKKKLVFNQLSKFEPIKVLQIAKIQDSWNFGSSTFLRLKLARSLEVGIMMLQMARAGHIENFILPSSHKLILAHSS